ncbi:MAG: RNase J family beta-CASP ribonuclease [Nanoarchaeota archaeon]
MIQVFSIGGYSEVGKNMTAVKVDDEIIILDMGLYLPAVLEYEEGDPHDLSTKDLIKIGAIPNDDILQDYKDKVKAIILGHCHLDHIGAIPYLAHNYNCPIIGTPYTLEVLKNILEEHHVTLTKRFKVLNYNSSLNISKNIKIEFVNITHSTLQTVLVVLHTKYGNIIYANDFKLDNYPTIGKKPNYERLKKLSENCLLLIMDSLYSNLEAKTPSEKVAKEMLKEVLLGIKNKDHAIIVTTFSSHIARLKSIVEFGRTLNRKIVFLGRSLYNYVKAAEKLNLADFKGVELVGFRRNIKKILMKIEKEGRSNYLIVCTGNQGEPEAVLTRIAKKELPFELLPDDIIIFSCRTIPTEMTIRNREYVENRLKQFHVRIFTEVHVSGHAAREDHRDIINILKPKNIIPTHGDHKITKGLETLAEELGYKLGKTVHLLSDGKITEIS